MGLLAKSNLRFAIYGISHWHAEYYREILASDGLDYVGCTDSVPEEGCKKAQSWGIPFHDTLVDMVARTQPDFLFVLPRHDRAASDIIHAANMGLPFMAEKPLGLNAHEAARATSAVDQSGVFADVCLPNRHADIWNEIFKVHKDKLESNLLYAHFRTINGPPERYNDYGVPWMLDPVYSGGGALRNLGFHGADATICLCNGTIPEIVSANFIFDEGNKVERYAAVTLRTPAGGIITLEVGYALPGNTATDSEWRICTRKIHACQLGDYLIVQHANRNVESRKKVGDAREFYRRMVCASVAAFVDGRKPLAPFHQAVVAAQLLDSIYAVAQ